MVCRKLNKAIERYAKFDCRIFCEAVYQRFPREIREMLYEELFPTVPDGGSIEMWVAALLSGAM